MIIGFDLDNTIICYDHLFWSLALEQKLISEDVLPRKESVKKAIFEQFGEDRWTELQGVAYGPRLLEAQAFPGALDTVREIASLATVYIVSHKTRYPVIGERYDLQEAARGWLNHHRVLPLRASGGVFFEETRANKVARIKALGCRIFVDDLVEVFEERGFPETTQRILFSSSPPHDVSIQHAPDWSAIRNALVQAIASQ